MARTEDQPIFGRDVAEAVWRPTPDLLDGSRLARFLRTIGEPDIAAVQAHAVADPAWFWGAAVDDIEIAWQRRPTQVLDSSGGPEWTRWWRGGLLNYAAAAVEPRAARDPTAPAVTWEGEDGEVRTVTNAALLTAVADAARMLRSEGVGPGDRVGIFLPMLVETVVATLAVGWIGAIYTPIFSGYGAPAVATRLQDCEASVLITADGFLRRNSVVPIKAVADEAVALAPSVQRVLVVRRLGERAGSVPWDRDRDRWWEEAIIAARAAEDVDGGADPVEPAATDP